MSIHLKKFVEKSGKKALPYYIFHLLTRSSTLIENPRSLSCYLVISPLIAGGILLT